MNGFASMYGSGLGQSLFYFYYFPDDHIQIKLAVSIVDMGKVLINLIFTKRSR